MRINVVYASREPNRAGVILEALAGANMQVTVAQKAKEVMGLLAHRSCELLLVGQRLVDEEGLDLVKTLRARGPSKQLPIVALVEHGELPAAAGPPRPAYAGYFNQPKPRPRRQPAALPRAGQDPPAPSLLPGRADECLFELGRRRMRGSHQAVLRRTQSTPPRTSSRWAKSSST